MAELIRSLLIGEVFGQHMPGNLREPTCECGGSRGSPLAALDSLVEGAAIGRASEGCPGCFDERQFDSVEPAPTRTTLAQFAETFFPHAEANLAPATVSLYRAALKSLARVVQKGVLDSISSLDMERFKAARLKEVSPSKVNIDFACLKAFFEKAVSWNYHESNPCKGVKLIEIPPRRPVFVTEGEVGKLLATVDEPWFKEHLVFAVSIMMLAGEIVNLTWASVDMIR